MTTTNMKGRTWKTSHRYSTPVDAQGATRHSHERHVDVCTVRNAAQTSPGVYGTLTELLQLQLTLGQTYVKDLPRLARTPYRPELQRRRVTLTQELLAALSNELEELRDETPWKPWRKPFTMSKTNYANLGFELVDVLHFVLELALVWGFDAKMLWLAYHTKRSHNLRRPEHVHR